MISSVVSVEARDESVVGGSEEQAVANKNTLIRQVRILTMNMSVWSTAPFLTVSIDKVKLFNGSCREVSMQLVRWLDERESPAVFVPIFTFIDCLK